jgi:hypothetical protein
MTGTALLVLDVVHLTLTAIPAVPAILLALPFRDPSLVLPLCDQE